MPLKIKAENIMLNFIETLGDEFFGEGPTVLNIVFDFDTDDEWVEARLFRQGDPTDVIAESVGAETILDALIELEAEIDLPPPE